MAFTQIGRSYRLLPILNGGEAGSAIPQQVLQGAPYAFMYPASYYQNKTSVAALEAANAESGMEVLLYEDAADGTNSSDTTTSDRIVSAADLLIATDAIDQFSYSRTNVPQDDLAQIVARASLLDVMKRVAIVIRTGHGVYTQNAVETSLLEPMFSVASRVVDDNATEAVNRALTTLTQVKKKTITDLDSKLKEARLKMERANASSSSTDSSSNAANSSSPNDATKAAERAEQAAKTGANVVEPYANAVELTDSVAGVLIVDLGIGIGDAFRNSSAANQLRDKCLMIPFYDFGDPKRDIKNVVSFNILAFAFYENNNNAATNTSSSLSFPYSTYLLNGIDGKWVYRNVTTSGATVLSKSKEAQWILMEYTRYSKPKVTVEEFASMLDKSNANVDLYSLTRDFAKANPASYILFIRNPLA